MLLFFLSGQKGTSNAAIAMPANFKSSLPLLSEYRYQVYSPIKILVVFAINILI